MKGHAIASCRRRANARYRINENSRRSSDGRMPFAVPRFCLLSNASVVTTPNFRSANNTRLVRRPFARRLCTPVRRAPGWARAGWTHVDLMATIRERIDLCLPRTLRVGQEMSFHTHAACGIRRRHFVRTIVSTVLRDRLHLAYIKRFPSIFLRRPYGRVGHATYHHSP